MIFRRLNIYRLICSVGQNKFVCSWCPAAYGLRGVLLYRGLPEQRTYILKKEPGEPADLHNIPNVLVGRYRPGPFGLLLFNNQHVRELIIPNT
jgi:hypothetical protein